MNQQEELADAEPDTPIPSNENENGRHRISFR